MFGDSYSRAGDPSQTGRLQVARYVLRAPPKVKQFRDEPAAIHAGRSD